MKRGSSSRQARHYWVRKRKYSKKQAARTYNIQTVNQTKQIRGWESQERDMLKIPQNERRNLHFTRDERLLADWHNEMVIVIGLGVTIGTLMENLKEFSSRYDELNDIVLRSKVERFMERHNLVLRRAKSHKIVTQYELQPIIDTFSQEVLSFLDDYRMNLSQI